MTRAADMLNGQVGAVTDCEPCALLKTTSGVGSTAEKYSNVP
jgi:hypothetical protein